jgi:hypothetical protein
MKLCLFLLVAFIACAFGNYQGTSEYCESQNEFSCDRDCIWSPSNQMCNGACQYIDNLNTCNNRSGDIACAFFRGDCIDTSANDGSFCPSFITKDDCLSSNVNENMNDLDCEFNFQCRAVCSRLSQSSCNDRLDCSYNGTACAAKQNINDRDDTDDSQNVVAVRKTFTLSASLEEPLDLDDSAAVNTFKSNYANSLAQALNINKTRVIISSITSSFTVGSRISLMAQTSSVAIVTEIIPEDIDDPDDSSSELLYIALVEQLNDPSSTLNTNTTFGSSSTFGAITQLTYTKECSDGSSVDINSLCTVSSDDSDLSDSEIVAIAVVSIAAVSGGLGGGYYLYNKNSQTEKPFDTAEYILNEENV